MVPGWTVIGSHTGWLVAVVRGGLLALEQISTYARMNRVRAIGIRVDGVSVGGDSTTAAAASITTSNTATSTTTTTTSFITNIITTNTITAITTTTTSGGGALEDQARAHGGGACTQRRVAAGSSWHRLEQVDRNLDPCLIAPSSTVPRLHFRSCHFPSYSCHFLSRLVPTGIHAGLTIKFISLARYYFFVRS